MSDKTMDEMMAAVREHYPKAVLHNNSTPMFHVVNGPRSVSGFKVLSDLYLEPANAWAEAYSNLPTPEPQEASPQPSSTAPDWDGMPDWVMRYGPERDKDGYATGNLIPSDYGMWVSSVSVFRLKKELEAELAQLRAEIERKDKDFDEWFRRSPFSQARMAAAYRDVAKAAWDHKDYSLKYAATPSERDADEER